MPIFFHSFRKNKKTFIKNEPFAIFLTVLLVEVKKYPQKTDHLPFLRPVLLIGGFLDKTKKSNFGYILSIFPLIEKCKGNHGKSERVYASRRGS